MHALICDDDSFVLDTLEYALKRLGYQVERADSAQRALDVLRHSPIRLVITDWDMPGMNGLELCEAVRRDDLEGYIYVIMLTSMDTPQDRVQALRAGVDDFITKPFNAEELAKCLRTAERVLSLEPRDLAMFAVAKLAESRDPETEAHVERVQCFARLVAQQLATTEKYRTVVDTEFLRLIYQTSPLHDIGKMAIPDSILLKSDNLDAQETEAMKSHVVMGARTLEAALQRFPNARFLTMARDIAATHHEKYDGTGYPAGLSGESIPLSGRIVALADVYDTLTSRHICKSQLTHEQARQTIINERGKHFDPDVVDAFVAVAEQFVEVARHLAEDAAPVPGLPVVAARPAKGAAAERVDVLLVEDDKIVRDALCRLMEQAGHSVVWAEDGEAALPLVAQRRPRVIISDWTMPRMDGLELCRRVREQATCQSHFMMLTVFNDKVRLVDAFDAGVDDFLTKPFDARELLVRVRTALRGVTAQEQLREKTDGSMRLTAHLAMLNTRMEKLSLTDDLTGLYNRRHAMHRLDEQWALADRYGQPLTVAMLDIDHFKPVNDTHGHEAGDAVLKAVAVVLREQARVTDVVCRYGGEEFLVVFPTDTVEQATIFAERCRAAIEAKTFDACGHSVRVTISIGIATRGPETGTSTELLRSADLALYAAKSAGRNCVRAYESPAQQLARIA